MANKEETKMLKPPKSLAFVGDLSAGIEKNENLLLLDFKINLFIPYEVKKLTNARVTSSGKEIRIE